MKKTYTFGKITLTQQALAVFIVSIISSLSALFLIRKNPQLAVITFLVGLASGFYTTYLTNCTIVGHCNELAWFLVAMNILMALIVIPVRYKLARL